MMPHFALLFGVSTVALIAQYRRFSGGIRYVLGFVIVLMLTLFAGLRGNFVGADTIGYIERFLYLVSIDADWDGTSSAEPGYKTLVLIARLISDDPTVFLIVTSGVVSGLLVAGAYRMALIPPLALFVMIAFGFYAFHMNGLRQGLALAVYVHALPSLLQGRPARYGLWVLAASLFHTTAIFTLPLYPLFRIGFSIWTLGFLMVMAGLTTVGLDFVFQFAGLANERYALYGQSTATGGAMLTLFHVMLAAMFMLGRPMVRREWRADYDKLLMMLLFGAMIFVIVQLTGSYVEMTRMALYFTISMAFLWPILLRSVRSPNVRFSVIVAVMGMGCVYFFVFLNQIGGYIPFTFR